MEPELPDSELIYAKTTSGEEAMLQRTRVVQRNLRMVLILVDGNATVAELCDKTGNAQLTQSALVELEADGFIERRVDEDSVWKNGRRLAQRIRSKAGQPASEFSLFGKKTAAPSAPPSLPDADADADADIDDTTRLVPGSENDGERFSNGARSFLPISQASPSISPPSSPPTDSLTGPESRTVFLSKEEATPEVPAVWPASSVAPAPTFLARVKALLGGPTEDGGAGDGPDLKPLRRRRIHLTWPLVALLGVLTMSVLLVLITLLFPYSRYLPEVEDALAQSSGQKASVEDMSVTFYPLPGLLLANVRFGDAMAGEQIHVAELRLRPELDTLFSTKIVFREMELRDIDLTARAVASLSRMFETAARESAGARVQRVTISRAKVSFAGLGFAELNGELALSADGLLQSVALRSADRSMKVEAKPAADQLAVTAEGVAWRPSPKSLYRFDSFAFKGKVDGPVFVIEEMDLRIFSGRVSGAVILRSDGPPAMAGEIAFERIRAQGFGAALGVGDQFEGDLAGDLRFSAMARTWPAILQAVHAEGNFTIARGSLGGIDLPEAVRRASGTPATLGGATRFEQLSGAIRLTPERYRFSRLLLQAGTMQSTGQLEVSSDLQLRGRMDVQMRGRADATVPVAISGTLKTPQLESR